uniref:Uncharacterized protein n=1 Tax=Ciona intestinalis TaxID=7719 RepID=H2XU22_CIOIN
MRIAFTTNTTLHRATIALEDSSPREHRFSNNSCIFQLLHTMQLQELISYKPISTTY